MMQTGRQHYTSRPQHCRDRSLITTFRTRTRTLAGRGVKGPGAQEVIQGNCYEEIIHELASRLAAVAQQLPQHEQHIVGIAGSPGSGKSTLAQAVARQVNVLSQQQGLSRGAVVAPMDGFHLYKAQLDKMPDPQEAYARRGAPWTFDGEAFVAAVWRIRHQGAAALPSFDHAVGDPIENDIIIDCREHAVVLVEGNYLFLATDPWSQLQPLFDDSWFCDITVEAAMQRVFERQTAIGITPEQSHIRIATNDQPNALLVNESKPSARILVPSHVPFCGNST